MALRTISIRLAALALAVAACDRGGGGPQMPAQEYEQLVLESVKYLNERQDSLEREFKLSSRARPAWDQRTGKLTFSDSGKVVLEADVQFVGSLSKTKGTWMWAWANPSVQDRVKTGAETVRGYGRQYGVARLTEREWPAKPDDAWKMTALAARILNARGAYRTEDGDGITYLVLTALRRPGEVDPDSASLDTVPPPASEPAAKARPARRAPRDSSAGAGWRPPQ